MAKRWPKLNKRWDNRDHWQYHEEATDYGWLKRSLVAAIIFAVVYGLCISETTLGQSVTAGVKYMLQTETDFAYITDKITAYAPRNLDLSWLKRAQTTMTKPADPLMYMTKPVDGTLVAQFGWHTHPVLKQEMMHEGIDVEAPLGTSVRAAAPGKIKSVTDSAKIGKNIIIDHGQDISTVYGHLAEILVKPGDTVSQGQVIARVGKTGITTGPMLYFEVRVQGTAVDPLTRIKGEFPMKEGK